MIFKIEFVGKPDYCYAQAESQLHLLKSYDLEYSDLHDITKVTEISQEEAEKIMLKNMDYDEEFPDDMPKSFSLADSACGDDFVIIGSTEWL